MRFAAFFVFGLVSLCATAQEALLTHSTDFARVEPAVWVAEGWRVSNPDPVAGLVLFGGEPDKSPGLNRFS